ncbi:hypothetical protein HPP92_027609 [Vanilla planifolia]|uniref:Glycosyltransferase N-terminal domain-containing protein n=1 Tax=Vanilla planifolia TaxID=51239 RepID=A0A835PC11_VANPL|nr:hypothetical protein HPP92_027609 [Vanilla planifolia]
MATSTLSSTSPRTSPAVMASTFTTSLPPPSTAEPAAASTPPSPHTHLHFHDLPFPTSITFDHATVTAHLLPHLSSLLLSLSPSYRRVALLHDSSMSFATSAADLVPNAEPFAFHPASAISNLFFQWDTYGTKPDDDRLFRYDLDACFGVGFLDFIRRQGPMTSIDAGRVINTCRAVEGEFLDRLAWKGQRVFAVGPLNPIITVGGRENDVVVSWLDGQPPESVVYVSFGTTSTMSREQMRELAAGLEASMRRFLWVIRKPDRIEDEEPIDDDHLHGFDFEDFSKGLNRCEYNKLF